jgi:DNA-binding GntR family transcriptional regulator
MVSMAEMVQSTGNGNLHLLTRVPAPIREQLRQMMREAIFSHRWMPGSRIVEREVCEQTGASRTSVREALRQLETEGLVRTVPKRGLIVTVISAEEAQDMYELRVEMESFAVRLFCQRATEEHIAALRDAMAEIEQAGADDDYVRAVSANGHFYATILEGAGNSALTKSLNRLHGVISYLRATSMSQPGRMPIMLGEMRAIFNALEARDAKAAEKASSAHVRRAGETAIAAIKRGGLIGQGEAVSQQ